MNKIVTRHIGRSTWQGYEKDTPVLSSSNDHVYTRMEVIDKGGRYLTHYGVIRASVQDGGRTIKIFVEGDIEKKGLTDWNRLKEEGDYTGEPEFEIDYSKAQVVEAAALRKEGEA